MKVEKESRKNKAEDSFLARQEPCPPESGFGRRGVKLETIAVQSALDPFSPKTDSASSAVTL